MFQLFVRAGVACIALLAATPPSTLAQVHATQVGTFAGPQGTFDVLPDGRLVSVSPDGRIFVQDTALASGFSQVGSIDPALLSPAFGGAGFVRASPDGSRLAIGDNALNNQIHIVNFADLTTTSAAAVNSITVGNYEAHWADNNTVLVTGFDTGADIFRVDVNTAQVTTIVHNTGQGSGGITTNGQYMFAANGFDFSDGGAPTGNIRAFDLTQMLASASGVEFSTGILVADALSGSSLGFDNLGNLLVGGGDFFSGGNDFGYAAIIDARAIDAALAGGPLAPDSEETHLSPAGAGASYRIEYIDTLDRILVESGGQVWVYSIPAPGATALLLASLVVRRRR